MHDQYMSTKTITLEIDAYEKLRNQKRHPRESFSQVVRRAIWDTLGVSGRVLLDHLTRAAADKQVADDETLAELERIQAEDRPPRDKWNS